MDEKALKKLLKREIHEMFADLATGTSLQASEFQPGSKLVQIIG